MAYKVIILYQLYMPSYFLGTFTEYPYFFIRNHRAINFHLLSGSMIADNLFIWISP